MVPMSNKKSLLVVSHCPSPNTIALRESLLEAIAEQALENISVTSLSPFDTQPEHVIAADAIILGTTENLGYMSGALKDFFDRCYYPVLEKKQGLPFTFWVRAGHDGTGTCRAIKSITTGLRWRLIQEPLVCKGEFQEAFKEQLAELGLTIAVSLDAGMI